MKQRLTFLVGILSVLTIGIFIGSQVFKSDTVVEHKKVLEQSLKLESVSPPQDVSGQAPRVVSDSLTRDVVEPIPILESKPTSKNTSNSSLNSKKKQAKRLIDEIRNELKRKDFGTNIKEYIEKREDILKKYYNYTFDPATNNKINAYKYTARAIFSLKHFTGEEHRTLFEKSLSDMMTYLDCRYKTYYTQEQIDFLRLFMSDRMFYGVDRFKNFNPKSNCK